jgi:hypothetical protein
VARSSAVPPASPPSGAAATPDLLGLHRRNNRESSVLWDDFGSHRARVTELARSAAPAEPGRLVVLGAGNCNDLELEALAPHFRSIHLVDLDEEAITRARDRQPAEVANKLVLHAPVDLSGAYHRLGGFRKKPASGVDLALMPRTCVETVVAALPGEFDVVLSTCFLSQLMQSAFVSLGERHPQLHIIACALALGHVRTVARLLAPGGRAHLVTDAVTTETYPLIELWDRQPPRQLLEQLEKSDNVFSGTGPSFLRRILATDAQVTPLLEGSAQLVDPWLWRFTEERSYLVYSLAFQRRRA